ncbi:hypothetical protein DFH06DRAFT_1324569 [Mycena polygramma]|nr:hypothetical protein DFH06DRAFT_1324569 [Mycena polygramma]
MNAHPTPAVTHAHFAVLILRYIAAQLVHPNLREGAGDVYLQANVRKVDVFLWRTLRITDRVEGGSHKLHAPPPAAVRQMRGGWADHHLAGAIPRPASLLQRLLHLCVFQSGGRRFRFPCACRVRRREYVSLSSAGGLAAFRARAAGALATAGEGVHYRHFRRPALNGDVYDFLVSS